MHADTRRICIPRRRRNNSPPCSRLRWFYFSGTFYFLLGNHLPVRFVRAGLIQGTRTRFMMLVFRKKRDVRGIKVALKISFCAFGWIFRYFYGRKCVASRMRYCLMRYSARVWSNWACTGSRQRGCSTRFLLLLPRQGMRLVSVRERRVWLPLITSDVPGYAISRSPITDCWMN